MIPGPGATPQPLPIDANGWFTTRDLGSIDPDGLIWIEGRDGAIIVSGGLNVSPGEVEKVIETLPGVREAVVLGLPDEKWGEVVATVVEADPAAVTAADVGPPLPGAPGARPMSDAHPGGGWTAPHPGQAR